MPAGTTTAPHRALRLATVATCGVIVASALVGTDLSTPAKSQVLDYGLTTTAPVLTVPVLRSVPGVSNRVQVVSVPGYRGPVFVCRRPGSDCRELTGTALVPIGSYLDTSKGAVRLDTRRRNGSSTGTVVYAGLFQLQQVRRSNAVLTARLHGQLPQDCARRPRGASLRAGSSAGKRKPRRKLWSDGDGNFRAKGRYGNASVRGTKFVMEERCGGTFVRVVRGGVEIDDRPRGVTVTVRAPRSYLIRARR